MDTHSLTPVALGFLTVVNQAPHGLIGGYLIVDVGARPIEFHCTAPVRANRAQEVLYGATLEPYLYGEQIGSTLVRAAKARAQAVFTDCPPAMAAAPHVEPPMWLVLAAPREEDAPSLRIDAAEALPAPVGMTASRLGRNCVARGATGGSIGTALSVGGVPRANEIDELIASVAAALDLSEPFERIRAAIDEAQRGAR